MRFKSLKSRFTKRESISKPFEIPESLEVLLLKREYILEKAKYGSKAEEKQACDEARKMFDESNYNRANYKMLGLSFSELKYTTLQRNIALTLIKEIENCICEKDFSARIQKPNQEQKKTYDLNIGLS